MNENDFLGLLRGPTTDSVLLTVLVTIAGSPQLSGVLAYDVKSDLPRNGKECFKIARALGPGSVQFNAHSIQMIDNANIGPLNQLAGYVLDNNGPDLMVT